MKPRTRDKFQFHHVYIGSPGLSIHLADLDTRAANDDAFLNFRHNLNFFIKHFVKLPEAESSAPGQEKYGDNILELRPRDKVRHYFQLSEYK